MHGSMWFARVYQTIGSWHKCFIVESLLKYIRTEYMSFAWTRDEAIFKFMFSLFPAASVKPLSNAEEQTVSFNRWYLPPSRTPHHSTISKNQGGLLNLALKERIIELTVKKKNYYYI